MTEHIQNDGNQSYNAQEADRAAEMADVDDQFDIIQEIEQNED